jgi:hypothetical protein
VLAPLAGKLTARRTGCAPLAGKSTLNRLEHYGSTPCRYPTTMRHGCDAFFVTGLRARPRTTCTTAACSMVWTSRYPKQLVTA